METGLKRRKKPQTGVVKPYVDISGFTFTRKQDFNHTHSETDFLGANIAFIHASAKTKPQVRQNHNSVADQTQFMKCSHIQIR